MTEWCKAYTAIEEQTRARGGLPLRVSEVVRLLSRFEDTAAAFKRISDELDVLGRNSLDDELIAERLRMPREFIAALFTALRLGIDELVTINVGPAERIPAAGETRFQPRDLN